MIWYDAMREFKFLIQIADIKPVRKIKQKIIRSVLMGIRNLNNGFQKLSFGNLTNNKNNQINNVKNLNTGNKT